MNDDDFSFDIALIVGVLCLVFGLGIWLGDRSADSARIGGDDVPSDLTCEEDEGIGYDPRDQSGPRPITCVPYEVLEAGGNS